MDAASQAWAAWGSAAAAAAAAPSSHATTAYGAPVRARVAPAALSRIAAHITPAAAPAPKAGGARVPAAPAPAAAASVKPSPAVHDPVARSAPQRTAAAASRNVRATAPRRAPRATPAHTPALSGDAAAAASVDGSDAAALASLLAHDMLHRAADAFMTQFIPLLASLDWKQWWYDVAAAADVSCGPDDVVPSGMPVVADAAGFAPHLSDLQVGVTHLLRDLTQHRLALAVSPAPGYSVDCTAWFTAFSSLAPRMMTSLPLLIACGSAARAHAPGEAAVVTATMMDIFTALAVDVLQQCGASVKNAVAHVKGMQAASAEPVAPPPPRILRRGDAVTGHGAAASAVATTVTGHVPQRGAAHAAEVAAAASCMDALLGLCVANVVTLIGCAAPRSRARGLIAASLALAAAAAHTRRWAGSTLAALSETTAKTTVPQLPAWRHVDAEWCLRMALRVHAATAATTLGYALLHSISGEDSSSLHALLQQAVQGRVCVDAVVDAVATRVRARARNETWKDFRVTPPAAGDDVQKDAVADADSTLPHALQQLQWTEGHRPQLKSSTASFHAVYSVLRAVRLCAAECASMVKCMRLHADDTSAVNRVAISTRAAACASAAAVAAERARSRVRSYMHRELMQAGDAPAAPLQRMRLTAFCDALRACCHCYMLVCNAERTLLAIDGAVSLRGFRECAHALLALVITMTAALARSHPASPELSLALEWLRVHVTQADVQACMQRVGKDVILEALRPLISVDAASHVCDMMRAALTAVRIMRAGSNNPGAPDGDEIGQVADSVTAREVDSPAPPAAPISIDTTSVDAIARAWRDVDAWESLPPLLQAVVPDVDDDDAFDERAALGFLVDDVMASPDMLDEVDGDAEPVVHAGSRETSAARSQRLARDFQDIALLWMVPTLPSRANTSSAVGGGAAGSEVAARP